MFVEIQLVRGVVGAGVNRDRNGYPKKFRFKNVDRSRVSSQATRRAVVAGARVAETDPNPAVRTRQFRQIVADAVKTAGIDADATKRNLAAAQIQRVLCGGELKADSNSSDKGDSSIFVTEKGIELLKTVVAEHWNDLSEPTSDSSPPAVLADVAPKVLAPGNSLRLALSGRMIAKHPDFNVRGALTGTTYGVDAHTVNVDDWTAVDDLHPGSEAAAMSDHDAANRTVATVYLQYFSLNWTQLLENLGGDLDLARAGAGATLASCVESFHQAGSTNGGFAPRPVTALVRVSEHPHGDLYAHAFSTPLDTMSDMPVEASRVLVDAWNRERRSYGRNSDRNFAMSMIDPEAIGLNRDEFVVADHLDQLVDNVAGTLSPQETR